MKIKIKDDYRTELFVRADIALQDELNSQFFFGANNTFGVEKFLYQRAYRALTGTIYEHIRPGITNSIDQNKDVGVDALKNAIEIATNFKQLCEEFLFPIIANANLQAEATEAIELANSIKEKLKSLDQSDISGISDLLLKAAIVNGNMNLIEYVLLNFSTISSVGEHLYTALSIHSSHGVVSTLYSQTLFINKKTGDKFNTYISTLPEEVVKTYFSESLVYLNTIHTDLDQDTLFSILKKYINTSATPLLLQQVLNNLKIQSDDLLVKEQDGKTLLDIAFESGKEKIKEFLISYQTFSQYVFIIPLNNSDVYSAKELLKSVQPDSLKLFFQAARHMGRPDLVMNVVQLFLESLGEVEVSAFRVADFLANIDDFHTMKYLRDKSKVNLNTTNESGETLLTKIVSSDKTPENLEKIKKLIILKADPLKKDREGQSAIDAAISNNHKDALVHFVTGDNNDEPLLIQAIKNGFSIEVISYFANTAPAIDISEAINYAIENGMDHIAKSLGYILAKCDSTESDAAFKIFYELIQLDNWIAVKFFQTHGLDINNKSSSADYLSSSVLNFYASIGNTNAVRKLVLDHKAEIDITNKYGNTPLQSSVENEHIETFQTLMALGANPLAEATEDAGYGLLHIAAKAGSHNIIASIMEIRFSPENVAELPDLLIKAKGPLNKYMFNVNAKNIPGGFTPLDVAAQYGNFLTILKLLIVYDAEVTEKTIEEMQETYKAFDLSIGTHTTKPENIESAKKCFMALNLLKFYYSLKNSNNPLGLNLLKEFATGFHKLEEKEEVQIKFVDSYLPKFIVYTTSLVEAASSADSHPGIEGYQTDAAMAGTSSLLGSFDDPKVDE